MQAITKRKVGELLRRGYVVMMGDDMTALMRSAVGLDGDVLLVEDRPAQTDPRGVILTPAAISYATLHDGELVGHMGVSLEQGWHPVRLLDYWYRRQALSIVMRPLGRHAVRV